jgi:drug/metabolite transporter (DMT)-like permease
MDQPIQTTAAPTPTTHRVLPYLALLVGVLCLSLSALFGRWANAPGVVTSFFRMGLATIILLPFFLRRTRPASFSGRFWWFAVLGGFFAGLDHGTWGTAINFTRVANATLLNNTAPIWVALFAWLVLREKLSRPFWIGLALTMAGALVVLGNDLLHQPHLGWGDMIALLSGVFYAGYFLSGQRARQGMATITYVGVGNAVSALTLLAIALLFKMPLTGFDDRTIFAFLGAAIISQVCGHFSLNYALGHLPASVVSPTMIAQPVLTALLAIPLVGEPLSAGQYIGGVAVLAGITIVNRSKT